jgi:hypothetical protein
MRSDQIRLEHPRRAKVKPKVKTSRRLSPAVIDRRKRRNGRAKTMIQSSLTGLAARVWPEARRRRTRQGALGQTASCCGASLLRGSCQSASCTARGVGLRPFAGTGRLAVESHAPNEAKGSRVDSLDRRHRHSCVGSPWLLWPGTVLQVAAPPRLALLISS